MNANHPLRRARWIWPSYGPDVVGGAHHPHNVHAEFRYDFPLTSVPKRALFYITADQCYMLYVNGRYVARGPARGYQHRWPFDQLDLTEHLRRGHNWISVRVYNGGVSTYQYVHQSAAGLLCAGQWKGAAVLSGSGWLMRVSPAHRRHTAPLSRQTNFQEHVDARLDDQSWIRSARRPAGWQTSGAGRAFGAMPWADVESRGIPHLTSDVLTYRQTCTAAAGRCAKGFDDWPNITDGLRDENPRLRWKAALPGRAGRDGLTVTLPRTGPGRLAAVSMDLGKPGIGNLIVEADGAAGGEIVDLFCCEALNDDGSPVLAVKERSCETSLSCRLRLRKGKTVHEFFQMLGHRYVVAIARDTRRPIRLKLALRQTIYPFDIRGRFETDSQTINDIYRICVDTQRVCSLDAYVDTPWREQAQWWGDARVQAQNTFHISGDTRLLVRGIRSIAVQEVPNGLTYGHAPTKAHHCILPDFSIIWVLTIWDYYYQTGDVSLFVEQWPRIQRVLGYFAGEGLGRNGLLQYDDRYWLFLDWCDIHKEGTPTLLNLWYVYMLDRLADLSKAAGMSAERRRLTSLGREHKRRVVARLFDRRKGLFRDGLTPDGKPVNVHSIHNQTLAILCGLQAAHHSAMVGRRLLPYLEEKRVAGPLPSSYWVTYVYDAMRRLGYARQVVEHIQRNWEPMIPYGGTWEMFIGRIGQSTASHAWAAHPIYHLTGTIGGIVQADVAWRKVQFAPLLDVREVARARAVVPTPQGLVRANWQRRDGEVAVSLSLPKGISAHVTLPGRRPGVVTGQREWLVELPAGRR